MRKRLTMVPSSPKPPAAPVLSKKDLDAMRMHVIGRRELRQSDRDKLRAARIVLSPAELARVLEQLLEGDVRMQVESDEAAAGDREIARLRAELEQLRAEAPAIEVLDGGKPFPPRSPGIAKRGATKKKNAA